MSAVTRPQPIECSDGQVASMRKFSLQNLLPADFQFSGDIQSELGKVVQQSFPINQVKDPRPRILVPRKVS